MNSYEIGAGKADAALVIHREGLEKAIVLDQELTALDRLSPYGIGFSQRISQALFERLAI